MAKILIVDDDYSYAEFAQMLLQGEGHETTICQNGNSAIETAKSEKPDLIVTDIGLPDISGFEIIKQLENTDETKGTPFIVCSMSHGATDPKSDRRVEEKNFFPKPLDSGKFLERIREVLAGT
jgi:two-component system cell cycle response regulator DivK